MARSSALRTVTFALLTLVAAPASAQQAIQPFLAEDVERTREFLVGNATGPSPMDCITTMNEAFRILYQDRGTRLSSTVDLTMAALERAGRSAPPRAFGFLDERGRRTIGVSAPETLRESLFDGLVNLVGRTPGWHLFGMSLLDGNHSVILALDLQDPEQPTVYWADQWSTKGGWLAYASAEELDGEVERLTSAWWRSKEASTGIKFKSDTRIYRLIPPLREEPAQDLQATVHRAAILNLRGGPGTDQPVLDRARRGQRFEVLSQQDQWVKIRLEDGREAWAHRNYLDLQPLASPRNAAGAEGALSAISSADERR